MSHYLNDDEVVFENGHYDVDTASMYQPNEPPLKPEVPAVKQGRFELVQDFIEGQNYVKMKTYFLQKKGRFRDKTFPSGQGALYKNENNFTKNLAIDVEWERAGKMLVRTNGAKPSFIVNGTTNFDFNQGNLGDCWYLPIIANISSYPRLFQRVVPPDQGFGDDYTGMFHFRFWRFGKWVDVVIDDYLPSRNGEPLFLHSATKHELWPALLEKAYAKLHGSYDAILFGLKIESMTDLTGGVVEFIREPESHDPDELLKILLNAKKHNSMMGCTMVDRERSGFFGQGLSYNRVYVVTKIVKYNQEYLIRIRNPWGKDTSDGDWYGPWSTKSRNWQQIAEKAKRTAGLIIESSGEFFMSMTDFKKNWNLLQIVHLQPDYNGVLLGGMVRLMRPWNYAIFHGMWKNGSAPQYKITLERSVTDDVDAETCLFSLMQNGVSAEMGKKRANYEKIGFYIFPVLPGDVLPLTDLKSRNGEYTGFQEEFEVLGRFQLKAGSHVLVPSTVSPNKELQFSIRMFCERRGTMTPVPTFQ